MSVLSVDEWAQDERPGLYGVGATAPNAARVCDYLLGGKDNYSADRGLAERVLRAAPVVSRTVRANRVFLERSVRALGRLGLRQFLDIGCGFPAESNVGDIARRTVPDAKVAYVDNDPVVLAHARALLATGPGLVAFEGDLREPHLIMGHPALKETFDPREPVALLLSGVLHFVTDEEGPRRIVAGLLRELPAGSHVVLTHAVRTPGLAAVTGLYREAGLPFVPRSRSEIAGLCAGLRPVDAVARPDEALPLACHVGKV
ncbi:SAM-dependent methyltransferase [Actinomadura macrotermitis]|uniref:SAM-dependent methyltransferase n=1 Tax=Actinomadura macrotermitis TaxID=2585200 RepID=A0A7K0BSN1_9ACTN|nr:SAM-dependent methyltransferase [Actinomadura macrotermitis]MQY04157.1 hypothetical protein [Actinomadura macrotermitis]